MPRQLSTAIEASLVATATRPAFFMAINHGGSEELISCTDDLVYAGDLYVAGGAKIVSITDSKSATFTLPITPERIAEVSAGDWRGGACRIYTAPSLPGDDLSYTADDVIEVLNGEIQLSSFSGNQITVTATHYNNANKLTPRYTWDELCDHIPAPGTILSWEGDDLVLSAQESASGETYTSNSSLAVGGRLTASQLKKLSQSSSTYTLTTTAAGAPIAVIYGQRPISGKIFAIGDISGDLVVGVGWGWGEIGSFEDVYINDEAIPVGVTATHYTGAFNQGVDPTLAAAIVAYNDTLVLETPAGLLAACYSVFRIPAGQLSTAPTFKAVINGTTVYDPRAVGENDPEYANTAFAINFDDPEDVSPNEFSHTLYSSVSINSSTGYLECTSGALRVAHDSVFEIGSSELCDINVRFVVDTVTGNYEAIAASGSNVGNTNRGWIITLDNTNKIRFRASSNGTSWDIADVTLSATAVTAGSEYVVSARRKSTNSWEIMLNGEVTNTFTSSSAIYNGSAGLSIGAQSDGTHVANPFTGRVKFFRLTVGGYRIPLDLSPISALPFPEYKQYSDNTALCAGDLASNPFYGMGATVLGLDVAADYDDELIDGANERARLSLALSDPRRTSEYLDLLCDYAECVWFNDSAAITIKPDRLIGADNPCGQEVTVNSSFDVDSDWSKGGPEWTIGSGSATCDGTQTTDSGITQTVPVDDDADYVVIASITCTAGTWSLLFGGVEIDSGSADEEAAIRVSVTFGTTKAVRFLGDSDFIGTVTYLAVKRLYWKESNFVKGTLSIDPRPDDDIPSSVRCRYTEALSSDPNWPEVTTTAVQLSGVSSGEIAAVDTTLSFKGVFRSAEALSKANSTLQRSINPVDYTWQTTDHAIRFRKADVVQLKFDQFGVDALVWISSVRMVSYGRYQVTGTGYNERHYPAELPSTSGGSIPVGAIVLLAGTTVPAGWAPYSDADGYAIICAGDTYTAGDTGGSDTHTGFSGDVSESDGHDGSYTSMKVTQAVYSAVGSASVIAGAPATGATHDHTFSTGTIEPDPYRRENTLIQKTGSTTTVFPAAAMTFGLKGINTANRARITTYAGRLLKAAAANADAGMATKSVSFTTGSTSFSHTHWTSTLTNQRQVDLDTVDTVHTKSSGGGSHTHSFSLTLNRNIKRARVALYGGTADYPLAPGDMVLWAGSLGSLPTDWYLCDGDNGTDDYTDHFIEIASNSNEGTTTGDNTISLSGSGSKVYHDHSSGTSANGDTKTSVNHSNSMAHQHSIDESDTWVPPYYALAMIMYAP